jgi:hypothetical protein
MFDDNVARLSSNSNCSPKSEALVYLKMIDVGFFNRHFCLELKHI